MWPNRFIGMFYCFTPKEEDKKSLDTLKVCSFMFPSTLFQVFEVFGYLNHAYVIACVCQMRQDLHSSLTSLFFIILSHFCSFQCMYEVGSPQFHTGVLLEEPDPNNY